MYRKWKRAETEMIKILSIGNSFSQDATAYLHDMAKCGGIDTKVVNLYIGGCSLYTHWENAENDLANYAYKLNGQDTDKQVSIKEALTEDDWDYVTMQQASHDSGIAETYFPYLAQLSEYVKKYAPNAVQLIHQTWAYEIDSSHSAFPLYENNQAIMYQALRLAYKKAAKILDLGIIPSGDVIQALRATKGFDYSNGGQTLCRDGFHMHLVYGRYAIAAVWYERILKGNILKNSYMPPSADIAIDDNLIEITKQTVHNLCSTPKQSVG